MKKTSRNYVHSARTKTNNANHDFYLTWIQRLISQHLFAASAATARICRTPVATLMTIAVIGLALALPAGLLLLLQQAQGIVDKWHQGTQISIFLEQGSSDNEIKQLLATLNQDRRVAKARYIAPLQVLKEFQAAAGIGEWTQQLGENLLPGIIEIIPSYRMYKFAAVEGLLEELKQLPNVEIAQLDVEWLNRLQGIINVVRHAALLLLVLVGSGVILVIANTIRLIQELYRHELEVMRLIGASQGFIRRPFVYSGIFYGILGGLVAWLILDFFIVWLREPLQNVFQLYTTSPVISELGLKTLFILILSGFLLGLIGSLGSVFVFSLKQERELLI